MAAVDRAVPATLPDSLMPCTKDASMSALQAIMAKRNVPRTNANETMSQTVHDDDENTNEIDDDDDDGPPITIQSFAAAGIIHSHVLWKKSSTKLMLLLLPSWCCCGCAKANLANAAPRAPRQPLDKARIPRKDEDEDDGSDDEYGVDDDEQVLLLLFTVMSFVAASLLERLWTCSIYFCFVVCRPKKLNSNLKNRPIFKIQFGKCATLTVTVSRDQVNIGQGRK